jgi:hypothetical protein
MIEEGYSFELSRMLFAREDHGTKTGSFERRVSVGALRGVCPTEIAVAKPLGAG